MKRNVINNGLSLLVAAYSRGCRTLGFYKEAQTPIALLQRPLNLYRPVCSFLVLEKSSRRCQEFQEHAIDPFRLLLGHIVLNAASNWDHSPSNSIGPNPWNTSTPM